MKKLNIFGMTAVCFLLLFLAASGCFAAEKTYMNCIGMQFTLIPAGSFTMGTDRSLRKAYIDETPHHPVTIGKSFYLGIYEVTQEQWTAVMGDNPSQYKGKDKPVEQVSWNDAQAFIEKLNAMEGHNRYRLPTEAEWEYAARAGTESAFSFGDDFRLLGEHGWHQSNSGYKTPQVGQKKPNPWGLYDMHGSMWEWVQDWYGRYPSTPVTDPQGPSAGSYRVARGGSWCDSAMDSRSAYRTASAPRYRSFSLGFRLALSLE